jgi:hypothetical protein
MRTSYEVCPIGPSIYLESYGSLELMNESSLTQKESFEWILGVIRSRPIIVPPTRSRKLKSRSTADFRPAPR